MSSLYLNPDEYPWKIEARVTRHGRIDPNERVVLKHAQLRSADYSGRRLKQFCVIGSRLEDCRFEGIKIEDFAFGAGMESSEFIECRFDSARLDVGGGFARFVRCSFRDVDMRGWRCYQTEFIDCVFGGRLEECIFYGTVPEKDRPWVGRERNEFRGNDFSDCDFVDVAFRTGIDLSQQKLPNGPEYLYLPDAAVAIQRARSIVQEWRDPALREKGLSFLKWMDVGLQGGQRQRLLRIKDFYDNDPHDVIDGVFAALRS